MMLQSLFAFAYKVKRTFLRPENPLSFEAHPNRRVFLSGFKMLFGRVQKQFFKGLSICGNLSLLEIMSGGFFT